MPESTELTLQQRGKVEEWLKKHKLLNRSCPVCGGKNWNMVLQIGGIQQVTIEGLDMNPQSNGLAVLFSECKVCGHLQGFNARTIGIV